MTGIASKHLLMPDPQSGINLNKDAEGAESWVSISGGCYNVNKKFRAGQAFTTRPLKEGHPLNRIE
jgi:hypothetical protein